MNAPQKCTSTTQLTNAQMHFQHLLVTSLNTLLAPHECTHPNAPSLCREVSWFRKRHLSKRSINQPNRGLLGTSGCLVRGTPSHQVSRWLKQQNTNHVCKILSLILALHCLLPTPLVDLSIGPLDWHLQAQNP